MRILFLVHAFNGLAQRLYVELGADGHELSVEFDIHDDVTSEAAALFSPDVILAPYLRRSIPAAVWRRYLCLIVHPGPPGDRGPAALDWAILGGERLWGVTVLQAAAGWDAGAVWARADFAMRTAAKASLYRHEVTECAVVAVRAALARVSARAGADAAISADGVRGWQPPLRPAQRRIDWDADSTHTVLRKIHSADSDPGVSDTLLGQEYRLFDARAAPTHGGKPGALVARGHGAVCRATRDGAVWIGQLRPNDGSAASFRQPATHILGAVAEALPESGAAPDEIRYEEAGAVGRLYFDFHNGALSALQCERLRAAYARACARPTRVIMLMGGTDFWCNGMHLHCIEAADSPADASWENINRIDDLTRDILTTETHLTLAAVGGNAAAGGVFMALACDRVLARSGSVLNPHYRNMGNLYGSEYWTYLLPRRLGASAAAELMARRLPLGAPQALDCGLIDGHAGPDAAAFGALLTTEAARLADPAAFTVLLAAKRRQRARDEALRPLSSYREAELAQMRLNFYGFDPSYHIARRRLVTHSPQAWTPLHLAVHRRRLAS